MTMEYFDSRANPMPFQLLPERRPFGFRYVLIWAAIGETLAALSWVDQQLIGPDLYLEDMTGAWLWAGYPILFALCALVVQACRFAGNRWDLMRPERRDVYLKAARDIWPVYLLFAMMWIWPEGW